MPSRNATGVDSVPLTWSVRIAASTKPTGAPDSEYATNWTYRPGSAQKDDISDRCPSGVPPGQSAWRNASHPGCSTEAHGLIMTPDAGPEPVLLSGITLPI